MSQRENRDRRTLYCGNLHENVTEELLFELFLQVKEKRSSNERFLLNELFLQSGPLENVTIRREGRRSFAFITFKHEESVHYAEAIMENVFLYNRPLRLAARGSNKDLNNNANEPYTPEMYVNDNLFNRQSSWNSPQQSVPMPLFTSNPNESSTPFYQNDERSMNNNNNGAAAPVAGGSIRHDRRPKHQYHPYHRNDQDFHNGKQRNGNFNHQRRGGGNYNYYR